MVFECACNHPEDKKLSACSSDYKHLCRDILAHFSMPNCFISATPEGFSRMKSLLNVRSQYFNQIARPDFTAAIPKTFTLFLLCILKLICWRVLDRCHAAETKWPIILSHKRQNVINHRKWSRSRIKQSKPQTITWPLWCLTVGMKFFYWNPVLHLYQLEQDIYFPVHTKVIRIWIIIIII